MAGNRLRLLRLARGLTLDELTSKMDGFVTKQALSKYELNKGKPSATVVAHLVSALEVKASELWKEPQMEIRFLGYRKDSRLPKRERESIESFVIKSLEDRVRLQQMTNQAIGSHIPIQELPADNVDSIELAAQTLRDDWKLGKDPIANVTEVLEDHFIHVLPYPAREKFDGISAVAYGENGAVVATCAVTQNDVVGERWRYNLAHELGHLVLNLSQTSAEKQQEKAAHRFAGAFLVPYETFIRAVGPRRTNVTLSELLLHKRRFGMSIQAILHRMKDLKIISDTYYTYWCMQINKLHYRTEEPEPIAPEKPYWLRRTVLRAYAEGLLTEEDARRFLGPDMPQVQEPLGLAAKRAFMKLSMNERRRILAAQAETIKEHYEQNKEWQDIQGGDILDD